MLCQLVERKVLGSAPKYFLFAGDTTQVSTFFLRNKKMSKKQ